jgi:hypothetical protein
MPIFEFTCPYHGKFEALGARPTHAQCPYKVMDDAGFIVDECRFESPIVDYSLPARRNPRYGEQT